MPCELDFMSVSGDLCRRNQTAIAEAGLLDDGIGDT
jgi:hypothetical protein